ncbi:protein-lysine N-methyltransferase SMYD4-like [Saccoglossus kowalevskii]|uniref:Protein-lysine N-methyltransferase SMYD4 n=1 Tax=Saccoglossus kowalevskii TaxID=10224 RepID=A0ABM0GNG2_SACKO|nr:PREDICTED: SET and MYND domain-containing protein 4-like [Saccoglossus kowalevskii]
MASFYAGIAIDDVANILEELLLRCNTDDTSHSTKPETSSSSSQDGASSGEDKFVESKLLSNASKAVKLTNHGEKGRYILATETICRGEIIIKEKPYGCVLLPSHYNTRCYHCVRKTVAPIPCCTCTHVRYCSVECQQESWKSYHYIECPLWPFLSQAGNFSQLSLRILLKAGWSNIQKYSKEVSNPVSSSHIPGCDTRGNYKSDYNSIYSLITHSGKQPWKDVFFFTLTSILLSTLVTKLISPSDDVDDLLADTEAMKMTEAAEAENKSNRSPSEDESQINGSAPSRHTLDATDADRDRNTSQDNTTVCSNDSNKFLAAEQKLSLGDAEKAVASVLLHHLLQLRCNVHAVTEVATKTDSSTSFVATTQQIRIAVAVYGTASMLNHSCTPNVIAGYDGNQLTIRATEMIKKGGEVLHCYGPRVSDMFRDERLKVLRDQYYFTCKCMFCGIPQEAITPSGALRCPRCSDMSGVYQTPEVTGQCCNFDCHHSWKLGETDEKIENARQLFRVGKTLIGDKNKVKECLSTLHKAYKIQQSVLYKHNKELAETEDCLALCYASFGNYHYAAKYLKLSIKSNIILYGEDSIEIGHELYKLAQILFNCKNVTEGLGVIDKAVKIISDHYGENHSDVKELLQMKAVLKDYKDQ